MRALIFTALLLVLAGCADPYREALDSKQPVRPQPPFTAADMRALAPYENSALFSN